MTDLDRFTQRIKNLCASNNEQPSIESTRAVVAEINRFLFTTYDDIGTVNTLGNNLQYFSEYHRFWNENYKTVLNLEINDDVCKSVATALHDVYMKTKGRAYTTVYSITTLSPLIVIYRQVMPNHRKIGAFGGRKVKNRAITGNRKNRKSEDFW